MGVPVFRNQGVITHTVSPALLTTFLEKDQPLRSFPLAIYIYSYSNFSPDPFLGFGCPQRGKDPRGLSH